MNEEPEALTFTCDRCGYRYKRISDRKPFLCLRCLRYIAKSAYMAVTQDRYPLRNDDGPLANSDRR